MLLSKIKYLFNLSYNKFLDMSTNLKISTKGQGEVEGFVIRGLTEVVTYTPSRQEFILKN